MTGHTQPRVQYIRVILVLLGLSGCAGETPPADDAQVPPADRAIHAVGDTVVDTVMARDTAR